MTAATMLALQNLPVVGCVAATALLLQQGAAQMREMNPNFRLAGYITQPLRDEMNLARQSVLEGKVTDAITASCGVPFRLIESILHGMIIVPTFGLSRILRQSFSSYIPDLKPLQVAMITIFGTVPVGLVNVLGIQPAYPQFNLYLAPTLTTMAGLVTPFFPDQS